MIDLNVSLDENNEGNSLAYDSKNSSDEFRIFLHDDENPLINEGDDDFDKGDSDRVGDELVNEMLKDLEPNHAEKIVPPYVGKVFGLVDEIISECHEYARESGFQIRIRSSERNKESESKGKENGIEKKRNTVDYSDCVRLSLVCSKEGKFTSKSNNPRRPTTTTITGCQFKVNASLCNDGLWKLTWVVLDHNNPYNPENSKFMRNYKNISEEDKRRILENDTAVVPIAKNYNSFVVKYGGHEKVPFDEKDCRNLIGKVRRLSLQEGDFVAMRRHFCEMISSNSNFFYMYDTDDKGSLRNVFWADGRSRAAYKDFGDVISFDTTYVSNRYRMPFAAFIGVNNHGQSIILGCTLLAGEEASNFVWLFNAWMTCMSGKHPKAILTDQCKSISKAVAEVFPNTRHRWCIWHIMRNAKKNLGKHQKYEDVMKGLKNTLHDSLTITEFENAWDQWIRAYNLFNYTWCQEMYAQRERWVPIYFKNEFWASMSSTQRSEGMNFFFKGFVNVNTTLKQFLEQFGFALAKRVKEEDKETYRLNDSPLQCATYHSFEHVFQKLYTSRKFHEFQKQVKYMTYNNATKVCDDGKVCSYDIVVRRQWHGETKRNVFCVTIDRESLVVRCDCKNFEFKGIVCSHSLRVFHEEELTYVPERYILDRWRKDLPREHLKVLVPYYSLLKKKHVEIKRYEKMRSTFEPLSTKAMSNNAFYDEVMSVLSNLSLKAQSISEDGHGLMLQNLNCIGRVYGRKTTETPRETIELEENRSIINEEPVTDPVDRRRRGRPPTKRKGYYDDHDRPTKRAKKSTNTCTPPNVPHGIYFNQFAQTYQFHNVVYNPPYQVRPGPSLTFQQPQVSKYM